MTNEKYFVFKLSIFLGLIILVELKDLTIKDPELICNFNRAGYKICKSFNTIMKIEQANIELEGDQEVDIDDKNISSINPRAFNNLNIKKLKLKLTDDKLDLKPEGFIGLSMLESLEINSGIVFLKPLIFTGLESLRSLTLTIDGTRQNFKKSLPELVSLESLTIINSNMTNINCETFYKLYPAINKLDISNNNINTIGQSTFSTLNTLTTLIINNNNLKNLQEGMFDGLNQLTILDLSDNKINDIPSSFLNGTNITYLSLAKNKLTILKPGYFKGQNALKSLNLDYNRIHKINSMTFYKMALEKLTLRNNNLEIIDNFIFQGLVTDEIDISFNKIKQITNDAFKNTTIKSLILSKGIWGFTEAVNIIVL